LNLRQLKQLSRILRLEQVKWDFFENINYYFCLILFCSQAVFSDLRAFGERVAKEVDGWGRECEANPPRLVHFDPWGRRVDHIVTSAAWKRMKHLSAQEGLVAIGYERSFGEWRLVCNACCSLITHFCPFLFGLILFLWVPAVCTRWASCMFTPPRPVSTPALWPWLMELPKSSRWVILDSVTFLDWYHTSRILAKTKQPVTWSLKSKVSKKKSVFTKAIVHHRESDVQHNVEKIHACHPNLNLIRTLESQT